jgi:hypothetical protein
LQRLPLDPTTISADDIQHLRHLEQQAEPRTGDARLIDSILGRVRQHHDRLKANAQIAAAKAAPPVAPPKELVELLALSLEVENRGLTFDEAYGRASTQIQTAFNGLLQQHENQIAAAQAVVAAMGNAAA